MTQLAKVSPFNALYGELVHQGIVGFLKAAGGVQGLALPPPLPQMS